MHSESVGQGENVVFLHGWGGSVSAFLFVARRLCGCKSLLVDFPGFGSSPEPDVPYSVADYADAVLDEMNLQGVERAAFIGHSFGGRVALELAAKHPDRVRSLVLVDAAGLKPRRGLKYYFKITLHKILKKLGIKGLRGSADYAVLSPVMKETFKRVVNYDQTPLLGQISCPTAVFWGREDKTTPLYMAKKFKAEIADSELFYLDGGHYAYAETPELFAVILQAFLDGTNDGKTYTKRDKT